MPNSDPSLVHAVLQELERDSPIESRDIRVEVDAGVVSLNGTVPSWAARHAAERAAHRVRGVLDVANGLRVTIADTAQRTDTEIARAARRALERDVFMPSSHIRTTVSNGCVTLEGDVDNWNERDDAERTVRDLAGVRHVENKIAIVASAHAVDVQRSIADTLARESPQGLSHIHVEVHDGHATLSGPVSSWSVREASVQAARSTPGVRSVSDQLHVVIPDVPHRPSET